MSLLTLFSRLKTSLMPAASRLKGGEKDPMYDQAVAVIMKTGKPTTSSLQRHLLIGYNRAVRIMGEIEAAGLVSKTDHKHQREILVPRSNSQDD